MRIMVIPQTSPGTLILFQAKFTSNINIHYREAMIKAAKNYFIAYCFYITGYTWPWLMSECLWSSTRDRKHSQGGRFAAAQPIRWSGHHQLSHLHLIVIESQKFVSFFVFQIHDVKYWFHTLQWFKEENQYHNLHEHCFGLSTDNEPLPITRW